MSIRKSAVAALAVIAAAASAIALSATTSGASSPSRHDGGERRTAERTERFLRAFERRDIQAVSRMLDANVRLVHPITFSGAQEPEAVFDGKDEVIGYFRTVFQGMGRIDFVAERVSVAGDGRASFVQANGNFTTADGRPYNNVYVFRFDWRDGRIVAGEEYFNPVTFSKVFGRPLG